MGMNHSKDKGQETSGGYYPLPPPLGVVFLPHVTTGGIWGSVLVVWGIVLYVSSIHLSNILLVVGGMFFLKNFSGSQIVENYQKQKTNN